MLQLRHYTIDTCKGNPFNCDFIFKVLILPVISSTKCLFTIFICLDHYNIYHLYFFQLHVCMVDNNG